MEFLRFLGMNFDFSQIRVFVCFPTLIFPFYKMLFMNRLGFSCVADFLQGRLESSVKSMSKNSISGSFL